MDSEVQDDDMNVFELYTLYKECGAASVDVASLRGGEMFFALRCADEAAVAIERGARYAVVPETAGFRDVPGYIGVTDVQATMHELARWHRSMTFVCGKPIPVLVLMGKRHRSSVRELIRKSLAGRWNAAVSETRFGDNVDVPLALLGIGTETTAVMVEICSDDPDEVRKLVNVALPNYGLVTDVDDNSLSAAAELYDYLRRTSDKVFVDVDDPILCRMAADRGLNSNPERMESLVIPYGASYDRGHLHDDSRHAAASAVAGVLCRC